MIAIIDNGRDFSCHAIYFVNVPSAEAAEALAAFLCAVSFDDDAHVIGVADDVTWGRRPEDNATIDGVIDDAVWDIEWTRNPLLAMVAAEALIPFVTPETAEAIRRERRLVDAMEAEAKEVA